ncbi:ABC transporter permease [Pollutibacter soli]|uniref:ABC transporter permease n=1 Tax=Pollutibacter soli TaxID=3034157 RepID=UPI003013C856
MLKNLIVVALRNLKKDRGYSFLNILGLTIGITFSLFLIFYVLDELSFDRHHLKSDRINRIVAYISEPTNKMKWANTQFPLGPTLKLDYPEVEDAVRMVNSGRTMFKNGDNKIYDDKVYFTDSNFFNVFTHHIIEGNAKTALTEPNSLVLTKSVAEKFFGKNTKAVGKTLQNSNNEVYKVTAVMEDIPKSSHILYNILISRNTLPKDFANNWGSFGFYNYVLLKPNTSAVAFEKKLAPMYDKYMASIFKQYNIDIKYGVQPIRDIHLHSDFQGEPEELGSISYIYIFSAVALFMLIIACINYMNLTTARSARRAKEIGIRKVSGSKRSQLIAQFLVESTVTASIALVLSIGFVALLLPSFNNIAGKFISLKSLFEPSTLALMLGIILFVGFLGGSYPALYLSGFNPLAILKGNLSKSSSNVNLRRVLVVIQFSISIIMLICTWVVYGQLKYLRSKDLGFNQEQVISMNIDGNNANSKIHAFTDELRKNSKVRSVSTANTIPGGNINFQLFSVESKNGFVDKGVDVYNIDENYLNTLAIKIAKGRNFTGLSDTLHGIIVNESMAKEFGWDEPLGKRVKFPGDTSGAYLEVVGVVKDFHQKSLYNPIAPLILAYRNDNSNIQAKLEPGDITGTLKSMENSWKSMFPDLPFQYTFLDQDFDSQYAADKKRGKIFTIFSILTIAVTCLGLLGLIAFTTQQRQKEISIRKVMGAGTPQLVNLITRNFVALVGISCIIAFPVAWYFMSKWLKIFPYNTGLHVSTFIFAAIAVLLITLLTVITHTVKAALAKPATSLRSE